tara:strand:- start:1232 stop:3361 length:2130 start_codon:yes stop_codon:yes gene_type:complete
MTNKVYACISFLYAIFFSNIAYADINEYFKYKVGPSSSNYGNTGILEVPNARFMQEASLRFNFSSSFPNEYTTLTASPFNWFEATYRYTEVKNRKYGPSSYSGNQTLKDKGFDLKLLMVNETYYLPAIALGFRDLAGTGLFSSEYIVASKYINKFDFTLGLGWGILGTEGGFSNPFNSLSEGFKSRNDVLGQGGTFSYKNWFSGNTSLIGGVEYDIPKYGLRLKLEYDTSNPDYYKKVEEVKSRINYGVNFAFSENLDLSASFERGTDFRISFRLKGNFLEDTISKPKPKRVIRLDDDQLTKSNKDKGIFYRSLNKSLRDEQIYIQAANYKDDEVDVAIASSRFYSMTRPIGRTARIVSALTPPSVERINIHSMNGDIEVATVSLNRIQFDKADNFEGSDTEVLLTSEFASNNDKPLYLDALFMPTVKFPEFEWKMSPGIRHQIGGPEGFYLGQLFWLTDTSIKFRRNLSLFTSFGINIYDTFNNLNNPSQSTIPRVRSDIQDYLEQGKNNLQRMHLEYFYSPFKDIFVRGDLGILEEMFAGYGGEVLYRPFNRKFAVGLTMHKVRQRDYDQRFSLREYETTTGHLGFYYDLPFGVKSQVQAGKYLAGDKGVTIDFSRRFKTGFTVGVFATKTNLSADEFGEGSFDKGFYISVPVQLFYSDYRTGNISFGLQPLTKDGGAMLRKHNSLIGILGDHNLETLKRDWGYLLN